MSDPGQEPILPTTKVQIVETELRSIWQDRGRLEPSEVVVIASAPNHPLHQFFTWDDTEAARRFRLGQAATLIRLVKVTVEVTTVTGSLEPVRIREFIPARYAGTGTGYVPEESLRGDPLAQERVIRRMRMDFLALQRRYQHLDAWWALLAEEARKRAVGE